MKIEMSVKMTDKDGNVITRIVETEVTEFGNPETFHEVFDRFEKPVIKARNQIGENRRRNWKNLSKWGKYKSKQQQMILLSLLQWREVFLKSLSIYFPLSP